MDKASKFRFRPKAATGKIVAASQAYQTKAGVEIGIEPAKTNAAAATVVE